MRPASPKLLASWVLCSLLLSSTAFAAPKILNWSHDTDGVQEKITLRWDKTGQFEVKQFPEAREVVIVLSGTNFDNDVQTRLPVGDSLLLDRARIQEISGTGDGGKGTLVRLQLETWTKVTTESTPEGLVITLPVPEQVIAAKAEAEAPATPLEETGLVLTDEQIARLDSGSYGADRSPRTGAGQAPADGDASATLTEYWLPPSIKTEVKTSAGVDVNSLAVQTKLNEMVRRVDFQGTTLENVLRLISEEAELNLLIKPSDVAGKTVTLRLRNVTLRQMLDAILKNNDLGYTIEDGGIVRVVPREQVRTQEKETLTQTVSINWVDAADVRNSLNPFIDIEVGTLQVSAATNLLIIRDVPDNVQRLLDLINQIDQPEKQVLIEMRLVNMTETARREFGTRTGFMSKDTDPRRVVDGDGFVGTRTDSVTYNTTSDSSFNNSLTGITANRSNTVTAGTDSTSDFESGLAPQTIGSAGLLGTSAEAFSLTNRATIDILDETFDVDFAINAQEERGEATTLANPTILSLNNTPALVEIKRQIPYVSAVNSDQGSVGTIQFKDIGTKINLLPRITNHGWVQMAIRPEQIIDTGERPQGVPLTDERNIEASVIVRDEQTVALGGLRQFEATAAEAGVPFLLRIPVLSWLFKRQLNQQTKTELYLFVTPHVIKDPNPTPYQKAIYDKIDYNWDLPDYFFDEVSVRSAPEERSNPAAKYPASK